MDNSAHTLEKGRITALQLAFLIITTVIATADVFLPAYVAQEAKQDSWLSVIMGTAEAIIAANLILALGLSYPDKTIIQFSCDILGKPLGKLVGFLYVIFSLFICYAVTGELGEIFVISFNPSSPVVLYSTFSVVVAAYAVLKGLEVIARINDLLLPFGLLVLGFVALLNVPKMHMENFLPILYNGFYPSIKGGFLIQAWLLEVVFVLYLIPFVRDKKKIRKHINISMLVLCVSLMFGVMTIAVLGVLTERYMFPALQYIRYASIGRYVQNLDISIMVLWVSGIFVKIAITYYCTVLSCAQLLGFKDYKSLIVPIGLLIIAFSLDSTRMVTDMIHLTHYITPLYAFIMAVILPALLLSISLIKNKLRDTASAKAQT